MPKKPALKEKETFKLYSERLVKKLEKKMLDLEKSNERVKESEEKYRTIFEHAGGGVAILKKDTTIALVNSQFEKLFGYSKEEIEGKMSWAKFIHPDDVKKVLEYHKKRREKPNKVLTEYEIRSVTKNGEILNMLIDVTLIPGTKRSIMSLKDITERIKAERELKDINRILYAIRFVNQLIVREKDREKLLKEVCNNLVMDPIFNNIWIATLDDSCRILKIFYSSLNKETAHKLSQLKGTKLPKAIIDTLLQQEFYLAKDLNPSHKRYIPLDAEAINKTVMTPLKYNKKLYGFLNVSISEELFQDKGVRSLLKEVVGDISFALYNIEAEEKRKQLKEDIKESERKYRQIFEGVSEGIYRTTLGGEVLLANPGLAEILGFDTVDELSRFNVKTNYKNPTDRQNFAKLIEKNGKVENLESEWLKKDGSTVFVLENAHMVIDSSGEPLYYEGTVKDITERKKAEEREKQYIHNLEFLSKEAIQFLNLSLEQDIYKLIGKELQNLVSDAFIIIISYNKLSEQFRLRTLLGVGKRIKVIAKLLGKNPLSMSFSENKEMSSILRSRKLIKFPVADLYELSARQIPKTVCHTLEKFFNIGDIYLMGLLNKEELIGDVLILMHKGEEPKNFNLIETFINNMSVVLQREQAEKELKENFGKLQRALSGTIQAVAMIAEMRDPYTAGHQRHVAQLSSAIAREMNLSKEKINIINMAATIHDIGKVVIPIEILVKPTKLSTLEFSIIKTHSQAGYDILKDIDLPWPIAQIILQHHERMNGSGYPQGLSDKDIMLEAKIISVADVVEAMSTHRPYRPALGIEKALGEISKNKGILYDPEVVDVCIKLFKEKGFKFEKEKKLR